MGEMFVLPAFCFAGAGDGDEGEGEFVGGNFDFCAGVVFPVSFDFMALEDAVGALDEEVGGVAAFESGCQVQFEGFKPVVADFSAGFAPGEDGGIVGFQFVHLPFLVRCSGGGVSGAESVIRKVFTP